MTEYLQLWQQDDLLFCGLGQNNSSNHLHLRQKIPYIRKNTEKTDSAAMQS